MTLIATLEKRDSIRDQHKKHVLNLPLTSVLQSTLCWIHLGSRLRRITLDYSVQDKNLSFKSSTASEGCLILCGFLFTKCLCSSQKQFYSIESYTESWLY